MLEDRHIRLLRVIAASHRAGLGKVHRSAMRRCRGGPWPTSMRFRKRTKNSKGKSYCHKPKCGDKHKTAAQLAQFAKSRLVGRRYCHDYCSQPADSDHDNEKPEACLPTASTWNKCEQYQINKQQRYAEKFDAVHNAPRFHGG